MDPNKKTVLIIGDMFSEEREFGSAELMTKTFKEQAGSMFDYYHCTYEDLVFHINNQETKVIDYRNNRDVSDYHFVLFRDWFLRFREQSYALGMYLESKGVPYFNKEVVKNRSSSKLTQYMFMALNDIPMPATVYSSNENLKKFIESDELNWPMVLKQRGGRRGLLNFLVNNKAEVVDKLNEFENKYFLLQEFIPNNHDLRVIYYKRPLIVMKRARISDETHLNNTSRGGTATLLEPTYIPKAFYAEMDKLVEEFGRTFTGIDLIYDAKSGSHTYLEINNMPQMETGSFVKEKLAILEQAIAEEIGQV